jgi:hypothetical protein
MPASRLHRPIPTQQQYAQSLVLYLLLVQTWVSSNDYASVEMGWRPKSLCGAAIHLSLTIMIIPQAPSGASRQHDHPASAVLRALDAPRSAATALRIDNLTLGWEPMVTVYEVSFADRGYLVVCQ